MRFGILLFVFLMVPSGCAVQKRAGNATGPPTGRVEEPDVAAVRDGRLAVTWAVVNTAGKADIVLSFFAPRENSWSAPRRVNLDSRTAVAGRQVGPRVAASPSGRIAVSWVDRARDPWGDIVVSVFDGRGEVFSPPQRVNDDAGTGTGQEYHDIAFTPDGSLCLVWLDERDAPADRENTKQLYFVSSPDGGRTFAPSEALTASPGGVCPCCRPTLVAGEDGSLHVIYRDRVGSSLFVRVRTRPGGEESFLDPVTLSSGWDFPGCPVNGPALAAGPDNKVWALWVDGDEDRESLWWARSDDGGRSFAVKQMIDPAGTFSAGAGRLGLAERAFSRAGATWVDGAGRVFFLTLPAHGRDLLWPPVVISAGDAAFARSPTIAATDRDVTICWVESSLLDDTSPEVPLPRARVLDWSITIGRAEGGPADRFRVSCTNG